MIAAALAAPAPPAGAQVEPDSPRAPATDSIAIVAPSAVGSSGPAARPDSAARRPSRFDQPRWVMMRSLVVPGWGQLTNGSWLKALAVAGGEIGLGAAIWNDHRELDRLVREYDATTDVERRNELARLYDERNSALVSREWLLGGLLVYALTDAYVDAHFRRFRIEFEHDPALPEGAPLPRGGRLSLRWTF